MNLRILALAALLLSGFGLNLNAHAGAIIPCSGDLNSGCSQIVGTHLSAPLPAAQGGSAYYYGTGGGTANAQTATGLIPSGFALTAGWHVSFSATATNTGASTFAANGTTATALRISGPAGLTALSGGEIVSGARYLVVYDGTFWVLTNPSLTPAFTSSLPGLAPASGGGTSNFLRADGSWAAPAGGGSVTAGCGIGVASSVASAAGNTAHGDSAYTILATDYWVTTSATLTAARTWTLPAASALLPGCTLTVSDAAGGVTATNTLTIARAGSDTISSATSVILKAAQTSVTLRSNGSNAWTIVGDELTIATSCPSHQYAIASNSSGSLLSCAQPSYSDLSGTAPAVVDVQAFTASGTWTNPAGCAAVTCHTIIAAIGAGGGGGGGARETLGTVGTGGGGGGGGQCIPSTEFSTTSLPATVTVTIGAAGTAGTGAVSAGVGVAGGLGGDTTFGSILTAYAGGGGSGGQTAASSAGGSSASFNADGQSGSGSTPGSQQGNGAVSGIAAGQGANNYSGSYAASGAGSSTTASFTGGSAQCAAAGGSGGTLLASSATGGGHGAGNYFGFGSAGGVTAGGAGNPSVAAPVSMLSMNGGQSGSGGGANTAGAGGAGGACASGTYGAGGSGGGAGTTAGGAGGPGCPGYLIAITTGAP